MEVVSTICRCKFCHQLGGRETFRVVDSLKGNQIEDHLKRHSYQSRLITGSLPWKIKQPNHNLLGKPQSDGTSASDQVSKTKVLDRVKSVGVGEVEAGEKVSIRKDEQEAISKKRKRQPLHSGSVLAHCRRTVKTKVKNGLLRCVKCDKRLKVTTGKYLNVQLIMQHVYCHLDTFFFGCRQCRYRSKTKSAMKVHLALQHNLRDVGNYANLSADHESEIIGMITRCFGQPALGRADVQSSASKSNSQKSLGRITQERPRNAITSKPSIVQEVKKPASKDPLVSARWSHCFQLYSKFQDANKVECRQCQVAVRLGHIKYYVPFCLIDHVTTIHLKKPLYVCRRCKKPCKSYGNFVSHIRTKHNTKKIRGEYVDYSNKFHQEIISTLSQCFDWSDRVDHKEQKKTDKRSNVKIDSVTDRALVLIKNCLQNGRVLCAECGSSLKVTDGNAICEERAIRHALPHLGKFLFQCLRCSHRTNTENAVKLHLKRNHAIAVAIVGTHYTDSTAYHQNEIIETLERCFGRSAICKGKIESCQVKLQLRSRIDVSQLLAARQLHCRYLYIKSGSPSRIDCRLCSDNVFCSPGLITRALRDHVEASHLKKPLYRCRHCSENINEYASVQKHTKAVHGFSKYSGHYDDLSDDYHQEIMSLLSECFDQESGGGGDAPNVEEKAANASVVEGTAPETMGKNQEVSIIAKDPAQEEWDQGISSISVITGNRQIEKAECSAQTDDKKQKPAGIEYDKQQMCLQQTCFDQGDQDNGKDGSESNLEQKAASAQVVEDIAVKAVTQNHEVSVIPKYSAQAESNQGISSVTVVHTNRPIEKIDSIETRVRALLENRTINGHVFCIQCVSPTRVAVGDAIDLSSVIGHAAFHLKKPLFKCQLCTYASLTMIVMENHLERNHGVANAKSYTDLTDKYREEILDMLGRCFGGNENVWDIKF